MKLCVSQLTSIESFQIQLIELLPILNVPSYVSSLEDSGQKGETKGFFTRLGLGARFNPVQLLFQYLSENAPVLILIDGFQPNDSFANWFQESFLKELNQANSSIVVIIADEKEKVSSLDVYAKEKINIDSLDHNPVRQYFLSIGNRITPPMHEDELDVYVKEACQNPGLIDSLTHVLLLTQAKDESPSVIDEHELKQK